MKTIRVPIPGFCLHERHKWEPYVNERGIDISLGRCYTAPDDVLGCYVIIQEREDEQGDEVADSD